MASASLTDTQGIVALAALTVALLALLAYVGLARAVHRVRAAQKLVLGDSSERDLVAHSASLQAAFEALERYVADTTVRLEDRLDGVELALTGAISHRALIRYDAYNELSGQQSASIALLDARGSGVVLSCIHHRDQARVYVKQILQGHGEIELSPEEAEAVSVALGEQAPAPTHVRSSTDARADSFDATGA
jgi:hypothetical protein